MFDLVDDNQKTLLSICLSNRNFEIELVWKRSQFFWLFNAAVAGGYGALREKSSGLLFLICCLGVVSSLCWTLINIGSKWWQVAWEKKLCKYQGPLEKGFLCNYEIPESEKVFIFKLRRFSVTGVLTAFSFFNFLVWTGLLIFQFYKSTIAIDVAHSGAGVKFFIMGAATFIFCAAVCIVSCGKSKIVLDEKCSHCKDCKTPLK